MSLCNLSSDLLGEILRFRDVSHQIIALWNCGNLILNSKLASGVTHVHLEGEKRFPCPYPLMLSNLRGLQRLYIDSHGEDSRDLMRELIKLSPTLEELHLLNSNSLEFLNFWSNDKHQASLTGDSSSHSSSLQLFPNLRTLQLSGRSTTALDDFHPPNYPWLPPSLTHLIMDSLAMTNAQPLLASLLPRSLLKLETAVFMNFDSSDAFQLFRDDWALAPPHLEYIGELVNNYRTEDSSWLPKTLVGGDIAPAMRTTPSLLANVPPLLEAMYIFAVSPDLFEALGIEWPCMLPKSLKSLVIEFTNFYFGLDARISYRLCQQIVNFPRSLTSMTIRGNHAMNWQSFDANPTENLFWPPALTALDLLQTKIALTHLHLIPRTLVTLKARLSLVKGQTIGVIDANIFSNKLTTLALSSYWDSSYLLIENQLPVSLTNLSIISTSSSFAGLSHKCFHQLKHLTFLKTLEIFSEYHREISGRKNKMLELPPNLTTLTTATWNTRWFSQIPSSVTSFSVTGLLDGVKDAKDLQLGVFHGLPSGLVSLHLNRGPKGDSHLDDLSASTFPTMPNLHHLSVKHLAEFDSCLLRALNSRLKTLDITFKSMRIEDAPFLPPGLTKLHITSVLGDIDLPVAEYWPVRADIAGSTIESNGPFALRVKQRRAEYTEQRLRLCSRFNSSTET